MAGLFGSLNEILGGTEKLSQSLDAHCGLNSIANMLLLSCRGLSPPRVDISVLFVLLLGIWEFQNFETYPSCKCGVQQLRYMKGDCNHIREIELV